MTPQREQNSRCVVYNGLKGLLISTLLKSENLNSAPIAIMKGERVERVAVGAWTQKGVFLELPPVVKRTSAVAAIELLDWHRRLLALLVRHLKRRKRMSRTPLSCPLHAKGYETYRPGSAFRSWSGSGSAIRLAPPRSRA